MTQPGPGPVPSPVPRSTNTAAIVGLVAGIAAVVASVFFSIVIGGILALVAVLAGNFGIQQAKKGQGGQGLAITGMVLGFVSIAINIIVPNVLD
ncbi:MAG: hypothetical protein ACRDHM_06740 [Actinomycetota bacterium]